MGEKESEVRSENDSEEEETYLGLHLKGDAHHPAGGLAAQ